MSDEGIPKDVRAFVVRYLKSVAHLEVALLLSSDPKRRWTPDELSRELRTNPAYAKSQLEQLEKSGLVHIVQGSQNQFCFTDQLELLDVCEQLRMLYNTWRPTIISLIYSQPLDKIRDLADGFVFKKD